MLPIDPEIQIKSTIKPGSIFLFADDDYLNSTPHYYVVLNHNPLKDTVLLLVCAVTLDGNVFCNIDNSPYPRETYVDVTPNQCSILRHVSLFDCNRVKERELAKLVDKLREKKLKHIGIIEHDVLKSLRTASIISPAIEENIKKLLRG